MEASIVQMIIATATAAACAYWQHSAGIISWGGCMLVAHLGCKYNLPKKN